ncbi:MULTISPECIES: DUF4235 domain-containing protein [unclassified Nocardioides]|uniref:DUF4235 domain-containing protein n=1 Tax=unclassified Nocardioides TaxID=2615069 RepID=UPI0006FF2295|nr:MULTISPECIES: DUF4235 domain-containing protein [unclassified Nocardioides]KQY64090.1 hypothetical protein ASD30_03755 [Nocardioides sp. Root140]KQZ70011.1 hypothetical protein ASD66_10020 [Nocardioides sp. Root151]
MASGSKAWSALSLGAALGSAAIAKKALNGGWKAATGKTPPANPADPDVDLWEAVMWAAVSGTAVAIVKMLATRKAANYFTKSTGHLPPGLEADGKASSSRSSDAGDVLASGIND